MEQLFLHFLIFSIQISKSTCLRGSCSGLLPKPSTFSRYLRSDAHISFLEEEDVLFHQESCSCYSYGTEFLALWWKFCGQEELWRRPNGPNAMQRKFYAEFDSLRSGQKNLKLFARLFDWSSASRCVGLQQIPMLHTM